MSKQKQKGTAFETAIVNFFADKQGRGAWRIALSGKNDCGDVAVDRYQQPLLVIECKNYKNFGESKLEEWKKQAIVEAKNYAEKNGVPTAPALAVKAVGVNGFYLFKDFEKVLPLGGSVAEFYFFRSKNENDTRTGY